MRSESSSSGYEASKWKSLCALVDAELDRWTTQLSGDCPQRLRDAIRYSLLAPGKRLRPILAMLGAEAISGDPGDGMAAACAVEMIHCYSLIHDDLPCMDDDDLRRGRPTCHIRFDQATAILAGDALQAMAFEVLAVGIVSAPTAIQACLLLAKAAGSESLVGGQMDDLQAEKEGGNQQLLQAIHRRKTGAMIVAAVKLGALSAGATPDQLSALERFGIAVGLAFQIVDDLLDVESTAESLGKRTGKDHDRGKLTYPAFYGIEASRVRARQLVEEAIDSVASLGDRSRSLAALAYYVLERGH